MDTLSSIIDSLSPHVSTAFKEIAEHRLGKEVLTTIRGAAESQLGSTVSSFANWVVASAGGTEDSRTPVPAWQRAFSLEQAPLMAEVLRLCEEITGSASAKGFLHEDGDTRLIDNDRQMSVGLGFDDDRKPMPVFLVEQRNDRTAPIFEAAKARPGEAPPWKAIEVGKLHVGSDQAGRRNTHIDPEAWRLGKPVACRSGRYGSLGAFVSFRDSGGGLQAGFLSASHVLLSQASQGTSDSVISSPVPPFVRHRRYGHRVGNLLEASELFHYRDAQDLAKVVNREDIGLVSLTNRPDNLANVVPDPNHDSVIEFIQSGGAQVPADLWERHAFEIDTAVPEMDNVDTAADLYGRQVYKVGATTFLTSGTIESLRVRSIRIKMADNRNYLYGDVILVRSADPERPFSEAGDSGALVYDSHGRAIGTVIGGKGLTTYVAPLDAALRLLDAHSCRLATATEFAGLP